MPEDRWGVRETDEYAVGELEISGEFKPKYSSKIFGKVKEFYTLYRNSFKENLFIAQKVNLRRKWEDASVMLLPID